MRIAFAAVGALALSLAEDSEVKSEEAAPEKIVDTVSLIVDFEKRPDDEGGNLFLVGFTEVDENSMPIQGSQPDDFQQIGVWVRTWPFEKEISVVRGLHYMGLYGYSEYPSDADLTTKAVQQRNCRSTSDSKPSPKRESRFPALRKKAPPPTSTVWTAKSFHEGSFQGT